MTPEGVGEMTQRPAITDPKQTTAKLASLKPGTNYRIYIKATTKAGVGEPYVLICYLLNLLYFRCYNDFLLIGFS